MSIVSQKAERYYVLPVRDIVIFPGVIVPLYVGRERSLKTVEKAKLEEKPLFIVTQKDLSIEDPDFQDLYTSGTTCRILQMIRIPDGSVKVLVEGQQ